MNEVCLDNILINLLFRGDIMKRILIALSTLCLAINITASEPEVQHFTDSEEDIKELTEGMSEQDKARLMEGINELRAAQAAFEIESKSFGATTLDDITKNTPRHIIAQEREENLKNLILHCSDENYIKQKLEECKLMTEENALRRLSSIDYHCSSIVYAIDGLADSIRLKEDKENYAQWLQYLENTSKKIKSNIDLVNNKRFSLKS